MSHFLIVGCSHHPVVTPKVVRKSFIPRSRPFLIGQRPRVWRRLIPWFAGMGNRRRANNPVSWKTKQNKQTKIKTEKSKSKLYGCFPTLPDQFVAQMLLGPFALVKFRNTEYTMYTMYIHAIQSWDYELPYTLYLFSLVCLHLDSACQSKRAKNVFASTVWWKLFLWLEDLSPHAINFVKNGKPYHCGLRSIGTQLEGCLLHQNDSVFHKADSKW